MTSDEKAGAAPAARSGQGATATLVGRGRELGLIDSFLDRAAAEGGALMLTGEPGVGKTMLLVVDDLKWLDRPSAMVLGLVARRLTGTRIGFLGAARPEEDRFFERRTLPGHEVRPLDQAAAEELIRACFPELAPQVRRRLLAEALGNPLALVELPAALTGPQRAGLAALPAVLPLHGRLQSLFASRVTSLPD